MELLELERLEGMVEQWINSEKLESYMQSRYDKWLVSHNGNYVEVFIADNEIDSLVYDEVGYQDIVDIAMRILADNGMERLYVIWLETIESIIKIDTFSEMIPYSDMEIELDNDGNILYVICDNQTKKEIIENAKRKY